MLSTLHASSHLCAQQCSGAGASTSSISQLRQMRHREMKRNVQSYIRWPVTQVKLEPISRE